MSSFFERNKKKGVLAALLLFLRRRKGLWPLLLMIFLFSVPFLLPADISLRIPFAAKIMNLLGVGSWRPSESFEQALKRSLLESREPSIWDRLIRSIRGNRPGESSIDLIRPGDFGRAIGNMVRRAYQPGSVSGVMTPSEAENLADGVPLSPGNFAGEAFANGVGPGTMGYAYPGGVFKGGVGMASQDSLSGVAIPGENGKISAFASGAVKLKNYKMQKIQANTVSKASQQLAQVKGISVALNSRSYPWEWQTMGRAPYFGERVPVDFIGIGAGEPVPMGVPNPNVDGAIADVQKCEDQINTCEQGMSVLRGQFNQLQTQIQGWVNQLPGACSDPCNCGYCNQLLDQIKTTCSGPLRNVVNQMNQSCDTSACPPSSQGTAGGTPQTTATICNTNAYSCGCGSFFCSVLCFFGG